MRREVKIVKIGAIILVAVIVLFLMFEFGVLRTGLWRKLPRYFQTQISFVELARIADGSCREGCVLYQGMYENIIIDYMASKQSILDAQIEDYINSSKVSLDFRLFLVGLRKAVERKKQELDAGYEMRVPDYLLSYLKDESNDGEIRAEILLRFGDELGEESWLVSDLVDAIGDKTKGFEERVLAIRSLGMLIVESEESGEEYKKNKGSLTPKYKNINYNETAEMFLSLAEDESEDDRVRYMASDALYSALMFSDAYTVDIFDRCLVIFNNRDTHLGIRSDIFASISLYNKIDLEKTVKIMDKIYKDETEHVFLNYDAWMFFDDMEMTEYKEPEIERSVYSKYLSEASSLFYYKEIN